ncbi:MAG: hypothetical protein RIQ89_5 [Bacteroidota bacterium]|jgi:AcrR family transcriptional regulator
MKELLAKLKVEVNNNLYLKDPITSELGQKILYHGLDLLERNGFENFTFRKLGEKIASTEASIYRYFDNKHRLLLYLIDWYWGWMEYKLMLSTSNIPSAEKRLEKAIQLITEEGPEIKNTLFDINKLQKVLNTESSKAYYTKDAEKYYKLGAFKNYKEFLDRFSTIIRDINPNYKYPQMLVSTIIEGANHQIFFTQHLPTLMDKSNGQAHITKFYHELVIKSLKPQA